MGKMCRNDRARALYELVKIAAKTPNALALAVEAYCVLEELLPVLKEREERAGRMGSLMLGRGGARKAIGLRVARIMEKYVAYQQSPCTRTAESAESTPPPTEAHGPTSS
jgi:hypothetical protein